MSKNLWTLSFITLMLGSCLPDGNSSDTSHNQLPSGSIIAFAGSEVPMGWTICDGSITSTGITTPDLRDRFIMGSGSLDEHQEGGSLSHIHKATSSEAEGPRVGVDKDTNYQLPVRAHKHSITTEESEHLPPYFSVTFIMKD